MCSSSQSVNFFREGGSLFSCLQDNITKIVHSCDGIWHTFTKLVHFRDGVWNTSTKIYFHGGFWRTFTKIRIFMTVHQYLPRKYLTVMKFPFSSSGSLGRSGPLALLRAKGPLVPSVICRRFISWAAPMAAL